MSSVRPAVTPPNRGTRRSIARSGGALGSAGVLVVGGAAALLTALAGSAAASSTIIVDNNGDDWVDASHCTDNTAGNCTIRDAAAAAVDGDTITFDAAISTITLTKGQIQTPAVTISGPGSGDLTITTDGLNGAFDGFRISGTGDAVVSGLTLSKIRILSDNSGKLTVNDVSISESSADFGGAIWALNSGDLEITDSTFDSNHGNDRGGAIYVGNSANTTISDSTFTNNTAGSYGGALHFEHSADITLNHVDITGNVSSGFGGGLMFTGDITGDVSISNSTIDSNSGTYGGGAYIASDVDFVMSNSTLSNNTANRGAGFIFEGAGNNAIINNSTITENAASHGGGGVYVQAGSSLTINQSTISANSAANRGGGINICGATAVVMLSGSINSGNSSGASGLADFALYCGSSGSFTSTNSVIGEIDSRLSHNSTNDVFADPLLGALADNGGTTKTMALLAGSPAVDAGPDPVATFTGNDYDQRGAGFPRVFHGKVDIGAFETQTDPVPTTSTTAPTTTSTISNGGAVVPGFAPGDSVRSGNLQTLVTLTDLSPGSTVSVVIHSEPIVLATGFADANGNFSQYVTIPANTPAGSHAITVSGIDANGNPVERSVYFSLNANGEVTAISTTEPTPDPTSTNGALPFTGSNSSEMLILGAGAALIGSGMALTARRRTRTSRS